MYEIRVCVWSTGVLVMIGENNVDGDSSVPSFTTNPAWNGLVSNQDFFSEKSNWTTARVAQVGCHCTWTFCLHVYNVYEIIQAVVRLDKGTVPPSITATCTAVQMQCDRRSCYSCKFILFAYHNGLSNPNIVKPSYFLMLRKCPLKINIIQIFDTYQQELMSVPTHFYSQSPAGVLLLN